MKMIKKKEKDFFNAKKKNTFLKIQTKAKQKC
jgi:hypothetical protein